MVVTMATKTHNKHSGSASHSSVDRLSGHSNDIQLDWAERTRSKQTNHINSSENNAPRSSKTEAVYASVKSLSSSAAKRTEVLVRDSVSGVTTSHDSVEGLTTSRHDKGFDFDTLRLSLHEAGTLFEDADFLAGDSSIYYSCRPVRPIEWLRPKEITGTKEAFLFVDGAARFDIRRGPLGDSWIMGSLAALSDNYELLFRVLPRGQGFRSPWYAGLFRFRFWRAGQWEEVVIDDLLPCVGGELAGLRSHAHNEFWSALVEKAYAKLHGSYEAIKCHTWADTLLEFSGGVPEVFSFSHLGKGAEQHPKLASLMFRALERSSVTCCYIKGEGSETRVLPNGLVTQQAYSVTDLREIRLIAEQGEYPITLVRLRNPWGNVVEWNGPWSLSSPEWNSINAEGRKRLGLEVRDDGEFWMDLADATGLLHELVIVHLPPDAAAAADTLPEHPDVLAELEGAWTAGLGAGGRPLPSRDYHWRNPQYLLSVEEGDGTQSCLLQLVQCCQRRIKHRPEPTCSAAIFVYKVSGGVPECPVMRGEGVSLLKHSNNFSDARQVSLRISVEAGHYIVIPCCYEEGKEGRFMVRALLPSGAQLSPLDYDFSLKPVPPPADSCRHEVKLKWTQRFYELSGEIMAVGFQEALSLINSVLSTEHEKLTLTSDAVYLMFKARAKNSKISFDDFLLMFSEVLLHKRRFQEVAESLTLHVAALSLPRLLSLLGISLPSSGVAGLVSRFADADHRLGFSAFTHAALLARAACETYVKHKDKTSDRVVLDREEWLKISCGL